MRVEFKRTISLKNSDVRLDKYLVSAGVGLSRSQIQKLIEEGKVVVGNKRVKPHYHLHGGDEVYAVFEKQERPQIEPEDIPLNIIYEDDEIIVVDKPPGLVVHPARGNLTHTLINGLLFHCKTLAKSDDKVRPGVIHRLDKNTSGLLVFAKTDEALRGLASQIAKREMNREYRAFCWGRFPQSSGAIEAPLGRHQIDRKVMTVTPFSCKTAVTKFEVIEKFKFITFLKLKLLTGRTHQIRVHLSYFGYPVVGDPTYGGRKKTILLSIGKIYAEKMDEVLQIMNRQALHAYSLGFEHPIKEKYMEFESPLPEDMERLHNYLRTGGGDV